MRKSLLELFDHAFEGVGVRSQEEKVVHVRDGVAGVWERQYKRKILILPIFGQAS